MAKKFVRGITDVKTINNQDFDTNNVNDLLSDGEHNYIHRKKKDKTEEYHNLTNNLKTLSSSNTDLLTITNDNNTTNSATLSPKHDTQKEQVIESTRNTININHGENGTSETTKVDTNPQKVLEHENIIAGDNLTKEHVTGTNTTTLKVSDDFTNKVNKATNDIVSINSTINDLKETKQDKLTGVNTQTATTVITSNNVRVNVTISEDEENRLETHNDGLFVPKLTGVDGITVLNDEVSLTHKDSFNGDLNTLTTTQLVKTTTGVTNIPSGESITDGILEVVKLGDVIKQVFTPFNNSMIYVRTANDLGKPTFKWYPWKRIALEALTTEASSIPEL